MYLIPGAISTRLFSEQNDRDGTIIPHNPLIPIKILLNSDGRFDSYTSLYIPPSNYEKLISFDNSCQTGAIKQKIKGIEQHKLIRLNHLKELYLENVLQ